MTKPPFLRILTSVDNLRATMPENLLCLCAGD